MEVVDAHHHFLDPERIEYPFLQFLPELRRFVGTSDLAPILREAGVARTVCVQAADTEDETAFLLEQAAGVDWVAGIVGWVPLVDPEATESAVERHLGGGGSLLRGIRHLIHDEPDPDWLLQPSVLESLEILAENDLSFDVSAFQPRHVEHVATLAERVPDLRVVLCHLGMPRVDQGEWEPWASAFARAAENPRAVVKFSAMDLFVGRVDVALFQRYVDHALECFGPSCMMWASNWPVSLQMRGYTELLEGARELVRGCSEAEQAEIFGGTARRVYRLDPRG